MKHDPAHYQLGKIQVWDFIADQDLDFFSGNIVKYVCRAGNKEGESTLDDLLKAATYLTKLIHLTKANEVLPTGPDGSSAEVPASYEPADSEFQPGRFGLTD